MRHGSETLRPNPFVVLADVSIALAFIMALASIAMSKELSDVTRNERQGQARKDVADIFLKNYAHSRREDIGKGMTLIWQDLPKGGTIRVSKIQTNSSYQRITLSGMFAPGGSILTAAAKPALRQLADYLREHRRQFAYLYFHGIAERGEPEIYARQNGKLIGRDELGAVRAGRVFEFFVNVRAIAPEPDLENDPRLNPRNAVPYGKSLLYEDHTPAGRVDILLFYQDEEEEQEGGKG